MLFWSWRRFSTSLKRIKVLVQSKAMHINDKFKIDTFPVGFEIIVSSSPPFAKEEAFFTTAVALSMICYFLPATKRRDR